MYAPRKDCLNSIGHGATVFVAAFPVPNELYNCAVLALDIFNTSNFLAYLSVSLLYV
jgi:hypothetical protein